LKSVSVEFSQISSELSGNKKDVMKLDETAIIDVPKADFFGQVFMLRMISSNFLA
jgi:hypothetical protein